MKSFVINVEWHNGDTAEVYLDGTDAITCTNDALERMDLPAEAWISTEECSK
jgi:hypothetical protein